MSRSKFAVIIVSVFVLIFQLGFFGFDEKVLYWMFALSPFLMAWLIYTVLKFGKPSVDNFEEKFYDDHSYRRNGKEEMVKESEELFAGY